MATTVRIIDPAKLVSLYTPATKFQGSVIQRGDEEVEFDFAFTSKSFADGREQLFLIEVDPKSRFIQATSFIHIEEDNSITIDYSGKQTKEHNGEQIDDFLLLLKAKVSPDGDLDELKEHTGVGASFDWVDVSSDNNLIELVSKHLHLLS